MAMNSRTLIVSLCLSAAGFAGIVLQEGYTDKAVIPVPGDVPTIGFGTTEGVKIGDRITPQQAIVRAVRDVQKFEGAIKQCVTVPLYQHEYDSFVSLAYNVGPSVFCKSLLVKRLNTEDYAGACEEIMRWRFFKGKDCAIPQNKCRGLYSRRKAEQSLCRGKS